MIVCMVDENLADMDKELAPDDQLRLLAVVFRLPLELALKDHDVWTFLTPDDLGDRWDIDVGVVPPDEFDRQIFPANLRRPFAIVQVWQHKGMDRQIFLIPLQLLAWRHTRR